jgi:hypothetical protein
MTRKSGTGGSIMNMRYEPEGPAGFEGGPASYPTEAPLPTTATTTATTSAGMGDRAGEAGSHMADVTKNQAGRVAGEAGRQAKNLMGQARTELTDQAGQQQERVASGLRTMSEQLTSMGDQAEAGMAADLVREAAQRTGSVADWLQARDPGSLVEEVKSFARRRPGTFITIAAVAGVALGRVTRAAVTNATETSGSHTTGMSSTGTAATGVVTPGVVPPVTTYTEPGLETEYSAGSEYSDVRDVTP